MQEKNNNKEPLSYLSSDPIFTLKEQKVCPYKDYIRLFFNLNKGFNILVIIATIVALGVNIFLNTLDYHLYNLIIYIFIGVIVLLLIFTNLYLPYRQMNKVKKHLNNDVLDFYNDSIVINYYLKNKAGETLENKVVFDLRDIKKKKEYKKSYILYQGKLGLILSKDNDYNEWCKTLLTDLFKSKK